MFVSGPQHAAACADAGASFVTFAYMPVSHPPHNQRTKGVVTDICVPCQLFVAWREATWSPWGRALRSLTLSTKRQVEDAIETTADYFRAHQVATQVVLSLEGVSKVSSARPFVHSAYSSGKSHRVSVPADSLALHSAYRASTPSRWTRTNRNRRRCR